MGVIFGIYLKVSESDLEILLFFFSAVHPRKRSLLGVSKLDRARVRVLITRYVRYGVISKGEVYDPSAVCV